MNQHQKSHLEDGGDAVSAQRSTVHSVLPFCMCQQIVCLKSL